MTDQPQTPSTPAVPVPTPVVVTVAPVVATTPALTFWQRVKQDLSYLWTNDRFFLIIFGVLILAAKFSSTIIGLIASKSRKDVIQAQQTDEQLKAKEDEYNAQANKLVDDANKLDDNLPPVDEDWNVKK
jgi:hypothetical protein